MINKIETPRPRVLLMAFMCSPERGSEWAVGWNRAIHCAASFDTWVICQGDQQAVEIKRYIEENGPVPGLHFEFIPYQSKRAQLFHPRGMTWLTYNLWHRKAFRVAQELHKKLQFDLVHHVTNTGFREPGYLWKLDVPFIWGPIGGTHNYPWRFLPVAGFPGGVFEVVRNIANRLQLHFSVRGHLASRRARAVLAPNATSRDEFSRARRIVPEVMLETGVSRVADSPTTRRSDAEPLRILWSGQFIPRKALPLLLEAMTGLPDDVACEVRVLGGGGLERRWKRLADRLGVASRVEWLGWLPYKEAQQQYDWADLFAFTSLRDNSGNVVLEALANGLPVVCLDHQGVRDIVTESCGIKVPVTNPRQVVADLRKALILLARDRELRRRMVAAALVRARDYLWSNMSDKMNDIYQRAFVEQQWGPNDRLLPATRGLSASEETLKVTRFGVPSAEVVADPCPVKTDKPVVASRSARLRRAAVWAARRAAVGLHKVSGERHRPGFSILMYHRVAEQPAGVDSPTWNVTPAQLRSQLAGLLSRGFEPWSLSKVLEAHRASRAVPSNAFVVTFDDGYENNYLCALPVLEELRVPATVFLATAYLDHDGPFPFDDWSAAGSTRVPESCWRPLTTEQCRRMTASGLVELGAHTHTHQRFSGRCQEFASDLETSLTVLRDRFDILRPTFAFPFGLNSPEMIDAAKKAGVRCALTTRPERSHVHSDAFGWGRFAADDADTAATLAAKMNGWYEPVAGVVRALQQPLATFARKTVEEAATSPNQRGIVDGDDLSLNREFAQAQSLERCER